MSKAQIDKLGDRIKQSNTSNEDLTLLDEYRRSFTEPYNLVLGKIRKELSQKPTGRQAKSTASIIDKLRRESIRLTQIQDIAGCRIVVPDIAEQDRIVSLLPDLGGNVSVADRRNKPSNGYRAVHVIYKIDGKPIEIQVRTRLQHLWAEWSEKLSDLFDPGIKYGKGPEVLIQSLTAISVALANFEKIELEIITLKNLLSKGKLKPQSNAVLRKLKKDYQDKKEELILHLREEVRRVSRLKRNKK